MNKLLYQIAIVGLLVILLANITINDYLYKDLLNTNRELTNLVEKQREDYEKITEDTRQEYAEYRLQVSQGVEPNLE